ncbi:MAG: hypothetical protein A2V88_07245 [Elusimicrobia bacterium RBG_16_66_12]|nr:MAG: hypothetical protein A2V88_07245 [Elusimicrobia bacterium RBG_16_66_12]
MRARPAVLAFLGGAAAFLVFLPSLSHGWLNWDDGLLLTGNIHYRGLGWENVRWAFSSAPGGAYQPLAFLSYGLDFVLWGMDPRGYHLTNILLHALNAALVFLAARRLLLLGAPGAGDGALDAAAFFAALVFALHPLRVESVSWAAERRDPLSAAFWLGAVLSYLHARRPGRRPRALTAVHALFAAACLSKAVAVTLPLVLLILDVWPLRRELRPALREKIPMFLLGLALGVLGIAAQAGARSSWSWSDHGPAARLAQSGYALCFYAWKTLWPAGLSPFYELPVPLRPLEPRFLLAAVVVGLFVSLAWRRRRGRPWLAAAGACYGVILLPVSGLAQAGAQLVADRYSYLSCLPWALLAGAGMLAALRRPRLHRAAAAAGALLVALLAAACVAQQAYWRDTRALWARVLVLDPSCATALVNMGTELAAAGLVAQAEGYFARAEADDPLCVPALERLAFLARRGDAQGPEAGRLRAVLAIRPVCRRARANRAAAWAGLGRWERARSGFESALAADPGDEASRRNLARLAALRPKRAQPR